MGAIVSGLYAALYQKQSLATEILMNEVRSTVPLSVSRREDVEHLRSRRNDLLVCDGGDRAESLFLRRGTLNGGQSGNHLL